MKAFNQISQTQIVFRQFGSYTLQTLNTVYGYYAITRTLSEEEYTKLSNGPSYTGPKHPAEQWLIDHPSCG